MSPTTSIATSSATWSVVRASGVASIGHDLPTIRASVGACLSRRKRTSWRGPLGERVCAGLVLPAPNDPRMAQADALDRTVALVRHALVGRGGLFEGGAPIAHASRGEVDLVVVVDALSSSPVLDEVPALAPLTRRLDESTAELGRRVAELVRGLGLEVRQVELRRGSAGAGLALVGGAHRGRLVVGVGRPLGGRALDLFELLGLSRSALQPDAAVAGEAAAALWLEPCPAPDPEPGGTTRTPHATARLTARVATSLEQALREAVDACPAPPGRLVSDTLGDAMSVAELETGRMRALSPRGLDLETSRPLRSLCDVGGATGVMLLALAATDVCAPDDEGRPVLVSLAHGAPPDAPGTRGPRAAAAVWRAPSPGGARP